MTAMYVADPMMVEQLRAEREANGHDLRDEVWEGVYFVPPSADNEHQNLAFRLANAFFAAMGGRGDVRICLAVNVSDRETDWKSNFRVPDISVILPGSRARDCRTYYCGGPDLIVEILSPGDRSYDKLPFYASVGVREALFIDRHPWSLEMYRLEGDQLILHGRVVPGDPTLLESTVVPASLRLIAAEPEPAIEVLHKDGQQRWTV